MFFQLGASSNLLLQTTNCILYLSYLNLSSLIISQGTIVPGILKSENSHMAC